MSVWPHAGDHYSLRPKREKPTVQCIFCFDECRVIATAGWEGHSQGFSICSPCLVLLEGIRNILHPNIAVGIFPDPVLLHTNGQYQLLFYTILRIPHEIH